jgi:hypothetical protein
MPKPKDPMPVSGDFVRRANDPIPTASRSARRAKDPIPLANRLLLIAAQAGWSGIKLIAKMAVRIPGLFVRLNTRSGSHPKNSPEP